MKKENKEEVYTGDWLEQIRKATSIIFDAAYIIKQKAASFYDIGNEIFSVELNLMADDLLKAQEVINRSVSYAVSEQVKRSGQTTATILKATLAGALLNNGKELNAEDKKFVETFIGDERK